MRLNSFPVYTFNHPCNRALSLSLSVTNCCKFRNTSKTCEFLYSDLPIVGMSANLDKTAHAHVEVACRRLHVVVGA